MVVGRVTIDGVWGRVGVIVACPSHTPTSGVHPSRPAESILTRGDQGPAPPVTPPPTHITPDGARPGGRG